LSKREYFPLASPPAGRFGLSLNLFFLCWHTVIFCTISGSNCTIFSLNKFEKLKMFLDLVCGLMVGPEARPVENHWFREYGFPEKKEMEGSPHLWTI